MIPNVFLGFLFKFTFQPAVGTVYAHVLADFEIYHCAEYVVEAARQTSHCRGVFVAELGTAPCDKRVCGDDRENEEDHYRVK